MAIRLRIQKNRTTMKVLTFEHMKPFTTGNGSVVTMKALLTIHDEQFVEVYENSTRYKVTELTPVHNHGENNVSASGH